MSVRLAVIGGLLAAALSAGSAWMAQGWRKDAEIAAQAAAYATERDAQAQAALAAIEAVREEGRRRIAVVEKARDEAQKLAAVAASDADGVRADLSRLRAHASALARAAAARDPAAADGGSAGADAVDLLAYMLGRVSERAAKLAEIADSARLAGRICESIHQSLSEGSRVR